MDYGMTTIKLFFKYLKLRCMYLEYPICFFYSNHRKYYDWRRFFFDKYPVDRVYFDGYRVVVD